MLLFTRSLLTKRFCLMSNERFIFTRSQSRNCFLLCFFSSPAHYEANVSICLLTIIWYVILLAHYKKNVSFPFLEWTQSRQTLQFIFCLRTIKPTFLFALLSDRAQQLNIMKTFPLRLLEWTLSDETLQSTTKNTVSDVFFHVQTNVSLPLGGMNVDRSHTNMTIK